MGQELGDKTDNRYHLKCISHLDKTFSKARFVGVNGPKDASQHFHGPWTASFLTAQGMQVVEYGSPTGASSTTKIILYSSKLYALRYLVEMFGAGSQQIIIQLDPASTVDIEIRIGEDWVGRVPAGY